MLPRNHLTQAGFTLVELIIVIVLLGILSIGTFAYLGFGAQIFTDVVGREQLSSQSRFAVERLTRELRNALPGSPRAFNNGDCIEFVPIRSSGLYLQTPAPDRPLPISIPQDISTPGFSALAPDDLTGLFVFIGANNDQRVYSPTSTSRGAIEPGSISTVGDDLYYEIDFAGSSEFSRQSPGRRYYLASSPVSWCLERQEEANSHRLVRYADYADFSSEREPRHTHLQALPASQRSIIASQLVNTNDESQQLFRTAQAALTRSNLILIDLYFARRNGQEPLILHHEVHLPNVP